MNNDIDKEGAIVAQPAQQSLLQDACMIIDQAQAIRHTAGFS